MKPTLRHWWRPALNRYGAAFLVRWSTEWEGNHIIVAKDEAQAVATFMGVLRWCKKEREDVPDVPQAFAGRLVYPPRVYFEAHAEAAAQAELESYKLFITSMLDKLHEHGKPLPEGARVCTANNGEEDPYHYNCVCEGERFIGYPFEEDYLTGGRERFAAHKKKQKWGETEPTQYDSTDPSVEHYDRLGPPLYGITGHGMKGMGIEELTKRDLQRCRHRPAYNRGYVLFLQGSEVPVSTAISGVVQQLKEKIKRANEETDRQRAEDFDRHKLNEVDEAADFFRK